MPTTIFTPSMLRNCSMGIPEIPGGGTPPFINTYSMDFDGVDDYLDLGTESTVANGGQFTFSFWIKGNSQSGARNLFSADYYNLHTFWTIQNTELYWRTINNNYKLLSSNLLDGNWHHILIVYNPDGADETIRCFTDGTNQVDVVTDFRYRSVGGLYDGPLRYIGNRGGGTFPGFNGNIDEFTVWNDDQSANISTIYNGGAPNDLTDLSPDYWLRNGDNGSYKSPQWLLPSNENKDKVSNYSYEFDGTLSRQIDVGTVNVGTTNITSMWLKRSAVSTQQTLLGGSSLVFPDYHMLLFTSNDFYVRYSPTVVIGWTQAAVKAVFNNTTDWINIVVVRNGDTVKLHLNGDNVGISPNSGGAIGALDTNFTDIGADINGAFPTFGTVNNLATWNVDSVLPSDIYNGGTPPDLTTLSTAPVNWWKMADDATFIYNTGSTSGVWTIPDNLGTNDGTSTGTIFNRVGLAPNSENNAVTINMDFVDRVPDTPPTP